MIKNTNKDLGESIKLKQENCMNCNLFDLDD